MPAVDVVAGPDGAAITYLKAEPRRLRDIGLDERWLQDRIEDDPSILGLGDVSVITRERTQPSGGQLDFLMFDPEEEGVRYDRRAQHRGDQ